VAKSRGFFAELQRQTQLAAKRRQQEANTAYRAQAAAARQAEQARNQAERAAGQMLRVTAAEQKAAERELQRLHQEAMQADVDVRNAALVRVYEEIDSMLAATLAVDDYVDLEQLRTAAEHPPFSRSDLTRPLLPPPLPSASSEPQYVPPVGEPGKIGGIFGGRKKYAELEAEAKQAFAIMYAAWVAEVAQLPVRQQQLQNQHQQAEQQRLVELEAANAKYTADCERREREVREANAQLDTLIQGLAYGVEGAIQEYVSIVLNNSIYPEAFPVEHDFEFNSSLKELTLTALVPPPEHLPSVKEYKYVRGKDEIAATALPQKDVKERYRNAVAQVAVRTLHEVFESDRAGRIQTTTLTVATETIDAATGLLKRTPLVSAAADRTSFTTFDLTNVVPLATLQHLGAQVSKNPADLVGIDTSKGVRGR
jgi:restriction system protein